MTTIFRFLKRYGTFILVQTAFLLCVILRNAVGICVVLSLCIIALLALRWVERWQTNRRIKALTRYLCTVQDRLSLPPMETDEDGEWGILQSEIYKVVALLRQQYSEEKRQKQYLADLLSNISHQIKTPLTAISLMTELLEQPSLTEEQRMDYAGKIDTQVTRITWLIRHLLTLSQLEAGVLELKHEEISVLSVMEQVRDSLNVLSELKGVEVHLAISSEITIKGDRHWLSEAMMNIVKNGIEHNDKQDGGYVRISATQTPIFVRVTIEDNGSGIDGQDLPHIFERFYKAKNAPSQSIGIGLSLAKQIVAGLNGKIEVQSAIQHGTIFTVTFYSI
ncbi:MAG: HAMP domain-containing histidine kinase [Clostridia bacterium]|nr:HAMP domain-containing histidine kinase [Clostridia bacterium]